MVSSNLLQVSVMSVQDPFVLDHNTASNVNERFRCDVVREFERASAQCRNLSTCSDGISAEHAGIVKLLADSTSSVSSPASSPQLVLSPQQTPDENAAGVDVHEALARMQLFLVRLRQSAESAAPPAQHKVAGLEHSIGEPEYGADDSVESISWHRSVTDVVKLMLTDIFDVDCVSRDQPTAQFDSLLSQLLTSKVKHHSSSSAPSRQQASNFQLDSQPHPTGSLKDCMTNVGRLDSCRKHLLTADDCDVDEDDGNDTSDNDPGQHRLGSTAAKRHKPDDISSDSDVNGSSASSGRHWSVADAERCVLLSVECSARSRLWVGRKKVRRQFLHFPDELKRQLEVSSALRSELPASDRAIIEFELAAIQRQSADEMLVAVLPSEKTSKEFGCFIMFFISLLQKLVDTVAVEGPVVL